MIQRTCASCGNTFTTSIGEPGRPRIKCLACGPRRTDSKPSKNASCRVCAKGVSPGRLYCSQRCKDAAKPRFPCVSCGKPSGWALSQRSKIADPSKIRCRPCRGYGSKAKRPSGPKFCAACSTEIPRRRKYCDPCRDAKQGPWQRRTFTPAARERQRQYRSPEHRAERCRVLAIVESGEAFCWRCGQHIAPGEPFHLGHDDDDRRIYRGAECPECNLRAAARKGRRMQHVYREAS